MKIIRIKNFLKDKLKRDGILYSIASSGYQSLSKLSRKSPPSIPLDSENSIFAHPEELEMCSLFPKEILELALEVFKPASVLDVGCGVGFSLDWFVKKGVDARGLEGSELARSEAKNKDRIILHDLQTPLSLNKRFDLVWSFEVAEHIRPEFADTFVDTLVQHGGNILLSAATPGQGGQGHFNEQPNEYWIQKMNLRGMQIDQTTTDRFRNTTSKWGNNIMIFREQTKAFNHE